MNKKKTIIDSFAVLVGKIFKGFSAVLVAWVVARLYGSEGSGYFYLALTIILILSQLAQVGLYQGSIKFVPKAIQDYGNLASKKLSFKIIVVVLVLSSAVMTLGFFIADGIGNEVYEDENLSRYIKMMLPVVVAWSVLRVGVSIWQSESDMRGVIYYENIMIPGGLLLNGLICWVGGYDLDVWLTLVVLTYLIIGVGFVIHMSVEVLRDIKLTKLMSASVSTYKLKEVFIYSAPLMVVGFVQQMMMWADTIMVGYFMEPSDVGIYNAVVRVAMASTILLYVVNTTMTPLISKACAKKNYQQVADIFHVSVYALTIISFPVFFLMIVFSGEIVNLFGEEFKAGSVPLIVLLAGQFVNVLSGPSGYVLTLSGREKVEVMNIFITFVMNVSLNILLIPIYGLTGAAIATASSLTLVNVFRVAQNKRIIGLPWLRKDMLIVILLIAASILTHVLIEELSDEFYLKIIPPSLFLISIVLLKRNKFIGLVKQLKIEKRVL